MSAPEFSASARDLDNAGRHFNFVVRSAWVRGALEGTGVSATGEDGDGVLDVRMSKSGPDVVVRGTLTVAVTVPCARCLEPARVTIRENLSALVVPGAPAPSQQASADSKADEAEEDVAADPDVMTYDGETVVLDDLVRDELLLAIPMIPLCSEGCPGISPESAPEMPRPNIDPRLAPLLKLKSKT